MKDRACGCDLAVLISFSGQGGVECMVMNLLGEFARRGLRVDLLPIRRAALDERDLPGNIRVIDLHAQHALTSVLPLARYLRRERPRVLLVAKDRAARSAVLARFLARVDTRIVVRLGTNLSAALQAKGGFSRWLRQAPMRRIYARVDRVIAVSNGVAEDTRQITSLCVDRVSAVKNPVVSSALHAQAAAASPHPWLDDPHFPVILGIGRLTEQKDFPSLIRAFARLRGERPLRLIILGEGKLRARLEALSSELGIAADCAFPGHVENPYAWMARAAVFVLSSAWEGSPNVLTEALALGVPVVATDCPSGPREILDGGRIAPLAPVGDVAAIAAAIAGILDQRPDADSLRAASADYTVERSADRYLEILGLGYDCPSIVSSLRRAKRRGNPEA